MSGMHLSEVPEQPHAAVRLIVAKFEAQLIRGDSQFENVHK